MNKKHKIICLGCRHYRGDEKECLVIDDLPMACECSGFEAGGRIKVWAVIRKDGKIVDDQTSFYLKRDYALSAVSQLNKSVSKNDKPYKVNPAFLSWE